MIRPVYSRWSIWTLISVAVLALLWTIMPVEAAFQVPPAKGYVNDNAHVLRPETVSGLTNIIQELHDKTQAEIAILTVDTLDGTPPEDAGLATARQWKVGDAKTKSGLLLLIAVKDRKIRQEVGYGLEGVLPDGLTGEIRDTILRPAFKQQDFDGGLTRATVAYASLIAKDRGVTLASLNGETYTPQARNKNNTGTNSWGFILIVFGIILAISFLRGLGGHGGFFPFFIPMGGGWSGGGGFGGSDGGGFGGFGGGDFGGGGSSGDW